MVGIFYAILKFVLHTFLVAWLVLSLVHAGLYLATGNPVDLLIDNRLSARQRMNLHTQFGYDLPPLKRYAVYLKRTFSGDLGQSFLYKTPVVRVLAPRLLKSLFLGFLALVLAVCIGISLLLLIQQTRFSWARRLAQGFSHLLLTVPGFVWAPIVLAWLSRSWGWFPAYGSSQLFQVEVQGISLWWDRLHHAFLPALCMSLPLAGQALAYIQEQIQGQGTQPFVLSALGRGVSPHRVFWNHQMRQIWPSLIQWLGLYLPALAGGAVVIEAVFGYPGLGLALFDAVMARDYPLLLGGCLLLTMIIVPCYRFSDSLRHRIGAGR